MREIPSVKMDFAASIKSGHESWEVSSKRQKRTDIMRKVPLVPTLCVIVLVLAFLGVFTVRGQAQAASLGTSQHTHRTWHVVPSPNSPQTYNVLNGVVALSADNVWAVGEDFSYPAPNQALIEHWNGKKWSIVPSPAIDSSGQLNGITRIPGTKELWAVGTQFSSANGPQTLIERWNGTRWKVVPSPILNEDPNAQTNILYRVTALSEDNAWAVGVYYESGDLPQEALIEHWDGKQWRVVPAATPPGTHYGWLYGTVALSAKDIWAVGTSTTTAGGGEMVLINHWNGKTWSLVAGPNPGMNANFLYSVARTPGTNELWAVGNYLTSGAYQTLIERWNGKKWSLVTSPSPGSNGNGLQGVVALSVNDAWAVGSDTSGNGDQVLTEHWNGAKWSVVASPNPANTNFLSAVTRVPGTDRLWAVGNYYDSNNNDLTLTEIYR